jgi:competence protein ComEC
LAITVTAIVTLDPLATWSIGFVLSVAATTGLVVITPLLGRSVFSATTAAQLGVAPFSMWWFGSMPIVALLTNVLAVPVASAVMMVGPLLLGAAAFAPDTVAVWCAVLVVAAVRWVWWVAELSARLAVPSWANAIGWMAVLAIVIRRVAAVARDSIHPRARL